MLSYYVKRKLCRSLLNIHMYVYCMYNGWSWPMPKQTPIWTLNAMQCLRTLYLSIYIYICTYISSFYHISCIYIYIYYIYYIYIYLREVITPWICQFKAYPENQFVHWCQCVCVSRGHHGSYGVTGPPDIFSDSDPMFI